MLLEGLRLIIPDNFKEFGKNVNNHINLIRNTEENYIVDMKLVRFNDGEGKCVLKESVRDMDIYILTDIKNYNITYKAQRRIHHMMPDEHYQDLKRIISAIAGHAKRVSIVMPFLYQSRQDKRSGRESLDCAMALKELEWYGVNEIVTFDAHEPKVANAVPNNMTFTNGYATGDIILSILNNENIDLDNLIVVAPDGGARNKAMLLADLLGGVKYGNFDKRRDYSKLIDGKHPIQYHEFVGPSDLNGMDVIVIDDMIASGASLIDAAKQLKERGAKKIYLMATFALFTNGVDVFNDAYKNGWFDKLYSTNLVYVPEEYKNLTWFCEVDCSCKVANIISHLNEGKSIKNLLDGKEETAQKIKMLKK